VSNLEVNPSLMQHVHYGIHLCALQRCPESYSVVQMQIILINKQRGSWDKKKEIYKRQKSDDSISPRSFGFISF